MGEMSSLGSLGLRTIILLCVSIIFVVSKDTTIERISTEKYLEAKRLVKSLNRPSVKSFQVENGDIFDCVPINKQLAFEHPSLKNHTIQMRPTSVPSFQKNGNSSNIYSTATALGLNGRRCPAASVLVRRIQVKDILRQSGSVSNFGRKFTGAVENSHYAIGIQNGGPFSGTRGFVGLWKPKSYQQNQQSIAQFWVSNGPEIIEAGWRRPYGEAKLEFFVHWTIDRYVNTGCYNLLCPGFVQVSRTTTVGAKIVPTSTYGGVQKSIGLSVQKDPETGHWLLYFDGEYIGYWPKTLFTQLKDGGANRVDWGGETQSFDDTIWPEMGSGHFPEEGYGKACYIWGTQIVNQNGAEAYDPTISETNSGLYKMVLAGVTEAKTTLVFGGPGLPGN